MSYNPIICAIDKAEHSDAMMLIANIKGSVGMVKLGLEYFIANGPEKVAKIAEESPVFLDLKLHDIPNTVAKSVKQMAGLGIDMLTIHSSSGINAMEKAANEVNKIQGKRPMLIAVTILTSLDEMEYRRIGFKLDIKNQVIHLAEMAKEAGFDGIVCSGEEVLQVKAELGKDFKAIVPGIRPDWYTVADDQSRRITPRQALENGADYIVIGRPINDASNPKETAKRVVDEISTLKKPIN